MDGSGRWAAARGRPRLDGHRNGADVVRRVVAAAPRFGIATLTLFAFSSDNWKRPRVEVESLMALVRDFLLDFKRSAMEAGVRIDVVGRRDRLSTDLLAAIETAEFETRNARSLHLRLAVDYSARDAILRAAQRCAHGASNEREDFMRALAEVCHASAPSPDVDLLIRTGGEKRLSDFLLWECAYAELYFTSRMWPEFDVRDLQSAVDEYHARERRFGCLPDARV
jgi:undecaprenyl diphosphate synthase